VHFEGKFTVNAPRETVWAYISDPYSALEYIPLIRKLDVQSEDKFTATVGVAVGWIKGVFDFEVERVEATVPSHARLKAHGSGIKSIADVDITIDLSDISDDKTDIAWMADARVGGLIAGVGQRLMGTATEKTMNELVERLRSKLEKE